MRDDAQGASHPVELCTPNLGAGHRPAAHRERVNPPPPTRIASGIEARPRSRPGPPKLIGLFLQAVSGLQHDELLDCWTARTRPLPSRIACDPAPHRRHSRVEARNKRFSAQLPNHERRAQRWWARLASASSSGKVSDPSDKPALVERGPVANYNRQRAGAHRQWHEADKLARCGPHQPEELLYVSACMLVASRAKN